MIRTYRGKLAISFSFFILIGLIVTSICLVYSNKVRKLDRLTIQAEKTYGLILMDQKVLGDFLTSAPTSSIFHLKENTEELGYHRNLINQIFLNLDILEKSLEDELNRIPQTIINIKELVHENQYQLEEIKKLLLLRGYKTRGVEGKMRVNIHKLELIPGFDKADILSLRRREKDYIIRYDSSYVEKLIRESDKMLFKLEQDNKLNFNQKELAAYHLKTYVASFKELVQLENQLGLRNNKSLKGAFNQTQDEIKSSFESGREEIELSKKDLLDSFNGILTACIVLILVVGLFTGIYLSQLLTVRINWLTKSINQFIVNDFAEDINQAFPIHKEKEDEIGALIKNFSLLKNKISTYISELKREKEVADKANQSKSLFLANMSHEIRTPMNGVLGITQMLETSEMDDIQKKYVEILKVSGQKLLGIINDILDFSKIESGEMSLEETQLEISQEIKKVHQILSLKADEKKLDFRVEIDPKIPKTVLGDPVRFNQIIFNLAGNAIKFTHQGFIIISAKLVSQDTDTVGIQVQVKDSGIGISPETQKKLFSAFSQADESTTRKFGGTGLGLTISQQLVKLMGGEITVQSEVEKGSTFSATLIFKQIQKPSKVSQALNSDKPHKFGIHVLVAEDNQINQRVVQMMLKKLGCSYTVCDNGLQAVEKVKKRNFDLIFMDIQMPVMDGFSASKEIKILQSQGLTPYTPIVALTANATESDRKKAKEIGMEDFITKPLKMDKLSETIIKFVQLKA